MHLYKTANFGLHVEKGNAYNSFFAWFHAAEKVVLFVPISNYSFSLWLTVARSC